MGGWGSMLDREHRFCQALPMLICGRLILVSGVLCALLGGTPVRADGFLLSKFGNYVPEKEQYAYIEWEAGRERLYVATRSEKSDGPALWIVPIPSPPREIQAQPVQAFPYVSLV